MMRNNEQIAEAGRADQLLVEMHTHINTLRLGQFAQAQKLRVSTKTLADILEELRRASATVNSHPPPFPRRHKDADEYDGDDDGYDDDFEEDVGAAEPAATAEDPAEEASRLICDLSKGIERKRKTATTTMMDVANGPQNAWEDLERGALQAPYHR